MIDSRLSEVLRSIVARSGGPRARVVALDARPLRGGISADEVLAARAEYLDAGGRRRVLSVAVKRLVGRARREIAVCRRLRLHAFRFAPRVLATDACADSTLLVLEWTRASERWPWRRVACAEAVIHAAAKLQGTAVASVAGWDHERELANRRTTAKRSSGETSPTARS